MNGHLTRLHRALLLASAGLVTVLLVELKSLVPPAEKESAATNVALTPHPLSATKQKPLPLIAEYEELIRRPLFNEDRRPHVDSTAADRSTSLTVSPPTFTLSAIVITPEKSIAIVQSANTKTLERLTVNAVKDGWTLAEIHSQYVVITQGTRTAILALEVTGSGTSPSPTQKTAQGRTPSPLLKDSQTEDTDQREGLNAVHPEVK